MKYSSPKILSKVVFFSEISLFLLTIFQLAYPFPLTKISATSIHKAHFAQNNVLQHILMF